MSNLHHASFHAVPAMLLLHGFEPRTDEGTQRLFSAHFVKPGLFEKSDLKTLGILESIMS